MHQNVTYYVDETGDTVFFNKRGKPVRFEEGNASRFFILGVVKIKDDIEQVKEKFEALRQELLQDPFLKGVGSLGKTAKAFHAKDDCSTVKREVFNLLKATNVSVHAIVLRKEQRLKDAITLYQLRGQKTHFSEREIYADLTKRIFKNLLHKAEQYDVIFAERGKTFTTHSLGIALEQARINFYNRWNIPVTSSVTPVAASPSCHIGLQIVDYYLWALKKLYEDGDSSFFELLKEDYKLIIDLDDTRRRPYGEYYDKKNKITLEKIEGAN